jgi:hypothetical protein
VIVLLACWLVAYVFIAGAVFRAFSLWLLLGIPLALGLLVLGGFLMFAFMDELAPADDSILYALVVFLVAGVATLFVAGATTDLAGAAVYHSHYGQHRTAVVTWITPIRNEYGSVTETWYHVVDPATGEDLGRLAEEPANETAEGDRIEVAVDPRGWLPPISVDRLTGTTTPAIILASCLGAMVLAALAIVGTALGAWVRQAIRGTSGQE